MSEIVAGLEWHNTGNRLAYGRLKTYKPSTAICYVTNKVPVMRDVGNISRL